MKLIILICCFTLNIVTGLLFKTEQTETELFIFQMKMSFNKAQAMCQKFGYNVIRIDNKEINKKVHKLTQIFNVNVVWIDGNDITKEGTFVNSEKKKLKYKNFGKNEPNNLKNEDCLELSDHFGGLWNDRDCQGQLNVICGQVSLKETKRKKSKYFRTTLFTPKGTFVLYDGKFTFKEGRELCKEEGLQLVKMLDDKTNTFFIELGNLFNIGNYWIDQNNMKRKIVFSNGVNSVTFDDPISLGSCFRQVHSNRSVWMTTACTDKYSVICY